MSGPQYKPGHTVYIRNYLAVIVKAEVICVHPISNGIQIFEVMDEFGHHYNLPGGDVSPSREEAVIRLRSWLESALARLDEAQG